LRAKKVNKLKIKCIVDQGFCGYPKFKINFLISILEWIFALRKQFQYGDSKYQYQY